MLWIQALPLMALVTLLASGRVGPPMACAVALVLTLPAAALHVPDALELPGFVLRSLAEGVWLAVVPVGIITGGLVFHAAVGARTGPATGASSASRTARLFTAAFLLGPFAETVTGFGVGTVFAVGAIRAAGVSGAAAGAIGLVNQTMSTWGGLGPGTAVGAALAGVDAQALAGRDAMLIAASLLLMLPLYWWWNSQAGVPVGWGDRLRQTGWVASIGGLLIVTHWFLPWQVCGALAVGLLLAVRLLAADPPRGVAGWRDALRAASPYLLLVGLLLGLRAWPDPPTLRPFATLPGVPLTHATVGLWLAALVMLRLTRRDLGFAMSALARGRRPAVTLLMFVILARALSNAGVPVALARAMVAGFGTAAPFASPILAAVAEFFAGTNVGSNSAMMPLQAALGHEAGLGDLVLPALQNGTMALVVSPQLTSVASGLAGEGATPARIWRLTWPTLLITLLVGMGSIVLG